MATAEPTSEDPGNPRKVNWLPSVCFLAMAGVLRAIRRRYLNTAPAYTMPRPTLPDPNAFDYYMRAGEMVKAIPASDRQEAMDLKTPPARVAALVAEAEPALREFRAGMRYPYASPIPADITVYFFPNFANFRAVAKMLIAEARSKQSQGDMEGALRSILDTLRLGSDIPRGAMLIHALLGLAIEKMGLTELTTLAGKLDARQCREAIKQLSLLESQRVPVTDILRGEYGYIRENLSTQSRHPRRGEEKPEGNLRAATQEIDRVFAAALLRGAQLAAYRKPLPRIRNKLLQQVPDYIEQLFHRYDAYTARYRMLKTELALRAYHLEQGKPSPSLEALVPEYLPAVPQDPFGAGGPLRYHRGANPLVYSVGPDKKDDGGWALLRRELHRLKQKDLIAKLDEYELKKC